MAYENRKYTSTGKLVFNFSPEIRKMAKIEGKSNS